MSRKSSPKSGCVSVFILHSVVFQKSGTECDNSKKTPLNKEHSSDLHFQWRMTSSARKFATCSELIHMWRRPDSDLITSKAFFHPVYTFMLQTQFVSFQRKKMWSNWAVLSKSSHYDTKRQKMCTLDTKSHTSPLLLMSAGNIYGLHTVLLCLCPTPAVFVLTVEECKCVWKWVNCQLVV